MPTTVTPTYKEPMPGWVDNLNGPVGVTMAGGRGVLRSIMCDGDLKADIIPVDMAIHSLIVIPYGFSRLATRPPEIPVYNLTVPESCRKPWKWVLDTGVRINKDYPQSWPLWYPNAVLTLNKYYHLFNCIFFMWLPAILIDGLLTIFRQRRFMIRVQTRIAIGLEVLQFFTTRAWDFRSNKFSELRNNLTPEDLEIFEIQSEKRTYDIDGYMKHCCLGGRLYVGKEPLSTVPRAKVILRCMYVLDIVCKTLICGWFFYWLATKLGIVDFIEDVFGN